MRQSSMNRFERIADTEATIHYLDGDYEVIKPGSYVICAVTGEKIPLDDLRYWSVARQEAYKDAHASLQRELEMNPELRQRRKG